MPPTEKDELLTKIDRIMRLVAIGATRDMTQRDRIAFLSGAGFPPKEIAEILGTSSNTVRVELVALRKGSRKTNSKKTKKKSG